MMCCKFSSGYIFMVAGILLTGSMQSAFAETTTVPLSAEEQAETDNRKVCKIKICKILAGKKAEGEDITCSVVKTVHKEKIEKKYLRGKIGWPYGKAQCTADVKLSRKMLVSGITTDGYEGTLDKHAVSCTLFTKDGKDSHKINLSIKPVIKWKGGLAESVVLNISDIGGTALAKSGIWTLAKANSYFGILDGPFKDKFNEFLTKDCAALLK